MKCIDLDIVAETFSVQSELDTPRQTDDGAFADAVGKAGGEIHAPCPGSDVDDDALLALFHLRKDMEN